jgi:hypothetical protein
MPHRGPACNRRTLYDRRRRRYNALRPPDPTMDDHEPPEPFFPRGAIASFAVMVAFYVGVWCGLYLVMAGRS